LVLQVVLPLVRALLAASGPGGNATLADRLAALINKHLSRCKPVLAAAAAEGAAAGAANGVELVDDPAQQSDQQQPVTGTGSGEVRTSLQADLRKLLYIASRDKDSRVAAAAGQGLLLLLAAACKADSSFAALAQETAAAALADVFEKKKSRIQRSWCEQLLMRCPEAVVAGDAAALQVLLKACSKARNDSVRAKAAQLLPILLQTSQHEQTAAVLAGMQRQQAAVAAAVSGAVTGPYKSKEQHAGCVKAVVQLLSAVQKAGGAGSRMAELLGPEAVRELSKSVLVVKVGQSSQGSLSCRACSAWACDGPVIGLHLCALQPVRTRC
jgi:hypothetical protein